MNDVNIEVGFFIEGRPVNVVLKEICDSYLLKPNDESIRQALKEELTEALNKAVPIVKVEGGGSSE